jgi:type IV pilus assembly protein PilQ
VQPASDQTEVIISVEGQADFRDFTMEGPSRLVVDLMGAQHALPKQNFFDIDRGGVRAIRTSQYSRDVVRVVLELDEVVGYQVLPGEGFLRVVLENPRGQFEPWSSAPAPEVLPARPVAPPAAYAPAQQQAQRITVSFSSTPITEVLFTFAEFADRSIVGGSELTSVVSAEIRDQPWDEALRVILEAQGLVAREMESGIIRVDNEENLFERETFEQLVTEAFQINYATAAELQVSIQALLSEDRGRVSVGESTNTLVVTDIPRVMERVRALVTELDRQTPQVNIAAKIIFVNRTDLSDFGVTYDLKDSEGNQLNVITPGAFDQNGDGIIQLPEEQAEVGTDVISLGGSSIAALGNARARIPNPTLSLLTSLVVGRHTLINFIEALESVNLSDVQAEPNLTVMDNQQARILVGEETPIRVLDASSGAAGGGAGGGGASLIPTAQVEIKETGIILEATPHVTNSGKILLQLHAERSAAITAESDAGFIFQTQEADSRVLVDDGETVVIAGLMVTEKNEVRSGIPLLMDIPILGRLFRVTRETSIQRDLLILVTPTIVRGDWD